MQQETIKQELNGSESRYEKGLDLYKQGKVFFAKGMYKVNGYEVDLRTPVECNCLTSKLGNKPVSISLRQSYLVRIVARQR